MIGWTFLPLPLANFKIGYVIKPNAMPVEILDVNGMARILTNADQLIFDKPSIMKQPTMIRMGAVIAGRDEIADTIGEKNIVIKNNPATTTAVKPVRPPAATPVLDST